MEERVKFGFVYKTINLINNKIYVGQAYSRKYKTNYLGSGKYIKRAIKKYGRDNFKRELIEWCDCQTQLNEREIYWIAKLDSRNQKVGYNITIGGEGNKGLWDKKSDEEKEAYKKIASDRFKKMWVDHRDMMLENALKFNPRRWSKEGEKEKHIQKNKERWGDNEYKKQTAAKIKEVRLNFSPEKKKDIYNKFKATIVNWSDQKKQERSERLSKLHKGKTPWSKGLRGIHSEVALEKLRQPKPKFPCTYCGMMTSKTNLKRWHNENCKKKNIINK